MNSNFAINLDHKDIISISGEDSLNFLQNIISNDVNLITKDKSIYSCLLSPQGKFLYDFMICKAPNDHLLLQCNKEISDDFINKLKIYRLRSKVEINKTEEYQSFFFNVANEVINTSFNKIKGSTIQNNYGLFFNDPRLDDFGIHGIIYATKVKNLIKDLNLKLLDINIFKNLCHNTGLIDFVPSQALSNYFSLELNLKELEGLSFKKGCFVGQENTARMNLKNKVRRRILPFQLIDGSVEINQEIHHNNNVIGSILSLDPNFAIIKIEETNNLFNLSIPLEKATIKIIKPFWLTI